ncbi:hypothetical protein ACH2G3_24845 [Bacillus cereus]|uniref:hypothetical protein n=1 Tax=Bacillus cereus group sp. MYBK185-1 TaxID=3450672 RepID=UPI0037B9968E
MGYGGSCGEGCGFAGGFSLYQKTYDPIEMVYTIFHQIHWFYYKHIWTLKKINNVPFATIMGRL